MTRRPPQRPSELRGTNYYPSSMAGTDNALGLLPKNGQPFLTPPTPGNLGAEDGLFDARHNLLELQEIRRAGFNNIRVWPSFFAWMSNRTNYKATLAQLVANCRSVGLTMTYIIWTTAEASVDKDNPAGFVFNTASTRWAFAGASRRDPDLHLWLWALAAGLYVQNYHRGKVPAGEPWFAGTHSEPGNYMFRRRLAFGSWPLEFHYLIDAYLEDIGAIFSTATGQAVLFSYDLLNEPDYNPVVFAQARDIMFDLLAFTQERLLRRTPAVRCTVGFAGIGTEQTRFMSDLYLRGVKLQYVSSHAYRTTVDMPDFTRTIRDAKAVATRLGLDYVCSEFWARWLAFPPPARVGPYLRVLRGFGVGGQIWSFLELNIFYRDAWEHWRTDPTVLPIVPPGSRVPPGGRGTQPIRTQLPLPEAVDGIRRPRRATWRFDSPWVASFGFDLTGSQADLDEIASWGLS